MLPFKTNAKIFIIEFVCTVVLFMVYAISLKGWDVVAYLAICILPSLFMGLIAYKGREQHIVLRCLYMTAVLTYCFMSVIVDIPGILSFMFISVAVSIALFVRPKIMTEYSIITVIALIIDAVYQGMRSESDGQIRLTVIFMMMYAFALVALLFIIIGVEQYKKDMEEKNEMAREALEAKSNFLANMSHEIRTPMNAIYGMAELLGEKEFEKEEKEYIGVIKNASENLLSIINEILDFSKIDSGKMQINAEPFNINNLLQDVISIIRFRMREKPIVLETKIDSSIPIELNGDEIRIRQILINLLNNAVKFTNRGTVTLEMKWERPTPTSGLLRMIVKDTGIGISQENMEKLFTAFGQLDTKKNRNVEGTGLGLAICKELIDLMNGSITVTSMLGQGSTFSVALPMKVYDPTPCNFKDSDELVYGGNEGFVIPFIAPKARVLIVDDNKVNRQVAKELMKLFGFEAALAESGQEAIDKIEKNLVSYDIVFMDHMMPFMDGVEATKQIRNLKNEYAKSVPIVALTANAITGVEKTFLDAGMNDYIPKPIKLDQLANILRTWLPRSKVFRPDITQEEIREYEENRDYSSMSKEEKLEYLDGIDTRTGLKNCADSIDVYFDLLQTYSTSNLAYVLNMYYEKEDLENYSITAHSIKGASVNIGAHDIAERAYSLERAGKRGDINYIWDNHQEFVDEYNKILRMLKKIFFGNIFG